MPIDFQQTIDNSTVIYNVYTECTMINDNSERKQNDIQCPPLVQVTNSNYYESCIYLFGVGMYWCMTLKRLLNSILMEDQILAIAESNEI